MSVRGDEGVTDLEFPHGHSERDWRDGKAVLVKLVLVDHELGRKLVGPRADCANSERRPRDERCPLGGSVATI